MERYGFKAGLFNEVLQRDNRQCFRCHTDVSESTARVDFVDLLNLGNTSFYAENLRTLCRRCFVLRANFRRQSMIANALSDGIIPPNWRGLVWENWEETMQ
jgi:hypothetical protein